MAPTTAWPPTSHTQARPTRRPQRSDAPQASDANAEKKDRNIPTPARPSSTWNTLERLHVHLGLTAGGANTTRPVHLSPSHQRCPPPPAGSAYQPAAGKRFLSSGGALSGWSSRQSTATPLTATAQPRGSCEPNLRHLGTGG